MSLLSRFTASVVTIAMLALVLAIGAQAQGRSQRRPPPAAAVIVRGQVFIGGYFYDPVYGRYPWWPRSAYPYWYFPVYDERADLRLRVTPETAAVYIDGFYAGIVEDFDGVFEGLPLPPGGHIVVLFLEGYRTARYNVYLRPASRFTIRDTLVRLRADERSEPPPIAPPVPPPPAGSYRTPRTPPPIVITEHAPPPAVGFGTLELRVQPPGADVWIDGQRWESSDDSFFAVQVPAGRHSIEIRKPGYRSYSREVTVRDGQTVALNISLYTTEAS